MSRTHAHRPAAAWLARPGCAYPLCDHRHGPCDLPARPMLADPDARCVWQPNWYRIGPICGCAICTDAPGRRAERRRDRHQARRLAHDARRSWRAELDGLDEPAEHGGPEEA